jgi:hypothetical protein
VLEAVEDEDQDRTLALATPIGPVILITDANTRFGIPDVERAGLDDLAVGDCMGAVGWWEEGNTFHAFGVARLANDHLFPLAGKLVDVGDDVLTVETERGSATVRVDDETEVRIPNVPNVEVEEPGLDDLNTGMRVAIRGTLNRDGSLLARVISVPRVEPRPLRLRGEVLEVDVEAGTFTVRTNRDRPLSVLTDGTTEFRIPGVEDPSIADLQAGDKIAGEGEAGEDGRARATLVLVPPEQVARLEGQVAGVDGTTLAVNTPGGQVAVVTDDETVIRIPGIEGPTLDDVETGDRVTAAGTWEDEATFRAVVVGVHGGRRAGQPGAVQGRAIRVGAESLVLGTLHGPVTVVVGDGTRYVVPGVDDPGLDDIETGALVGARGTWNEDGALQAQGVGVLDGARLRDARPRR